ncbi:MAG: NAD-dependent epimerase/dehydratase family protein [Chlorobi bacterium]|nr:NAD-dependent epimerase/dehydratase family protein [Chlorobiota bacterium]
MILVTGGTGLVGSHLIYKLTEKGHHVKAIYRTKEKINAVKHVFSYYTKDVDALFSKIEWIEANINDIPSLTNAFTGITKVYHCAAFISFDTRDYLTLRKINIEGTANIVNLCLSNNIEKLCYVSSIATIGKTESGMLINEDKHWNPDEDHNVYAITKYGAEMEVWRGTQEGLNAVVVNPGVIIGPGYWKSGSGSLINLVYKGLSYYTNGVVGYVDVKDVVLAMIELMKSDIQNKRYILVSENLSYKDFFTKVATQLHVKPPNKEASNFALNMAWKLDWLRSYIKNKRRRLTKHTAKTITTISCFSNKKVVADLNYTFIPIDVSIAETCQLFLEDLG